MGERECLPQHVHLLAALSFVGIFCLLLRRSSGYFGNSSGYFENGSEYVRNSSGYF